MKLIRIVIPGLFLFSTVLSTPAFAQQDPETTNSAELRRAIRERIEQTIKDPSRTESPYIGLLGTIEKIGTATFTVKTPRGEEKTIQVMEGTPLLLGGRSLKLNELVIGNGVSVIGTPLDELVVEARRVIMSSAPLVENRKVSLGTVTAWNQREMTVMVRGTENTETYSVNRQTVYEDIQGTPITARTIQEDQAVLLVTDQNTNGTRFIKRVRLLVPVEQE